MYTKDRTALSSEDYTSVSNRIISFAAREESKSLNVSISDDVMVEDDEWFEICLSDPIQGQLGSPRCSTVFIENDDCK